MAFGLSPKHEQSISTEGLTPGAFIALCVEAMTRLQWNIGGISAFSLTAFTGFSMSSYGEIVTVSVSDGQAMIGSKCTGTQFTDWGKNKRNVEKIIAACLELRQAFTAEALEERARLIGERISEEADQPPAQDEVETKTTLRDFLLIFVPSKDLFITPLLIDLNLLVFIIMAISGVGILSPGTDELLAWGASFKPAVLGGQWWRLFTCCFVHIGIIHLLMNMYALLYIGVLLEPLLGRARFLSSYLVAGIVSSLTSLWWNDWLVSAGASGAIFGMYGVFLALLTTNHIEKAARKQLLVSISVFVGYNLLFGMQGNIDNAAHIGGLLSGMVIGYIFYPGLRQTASQKKYEYAGIGFISVAAIAAIVLVCTNVQNDMGIYEKKMNEFTALETQALAVFQMPGNTHDKKALELIDVQGIRNWEKCCQLLTDVENLHLPDVIRRRNELLMSYCILRIQSYRFLGYAIGDKTSNYQLKIDSCNQKIGEVIEHINQLDK